MPPLVRPSSPLGGGPRGAYAQCNLLPENTVLEEERERGHRQPTRVAPLTAQTVLGSRLQGPPMSWPVLTLKAGGLVREDAGTPARPEPRCLLLGSWQGRKPPGQPGLWGLRHEEVGPDSGPDSRPVSGRSGSGPGPAIGSSVSSPGGAEARG